MNGDICHVYTVAVTVSPDCEGNKVKRKLEMFLKTFLKMFWKIGNVLLYLSVDYTDAFTNVHKVKIH